MTLFRKLVWIELKLFVREPISLIFTFAFPVVVLVVLSGVFGSTPTREFLYTRPVDYYQASYVAVVIAALSLVALPVHVATYRERGILRRLRASSVPASSVVSAQVLVTLLLAALGGLTLTAVGITLYSARSPESPVAVAAAFVLSALSFLAFGFLIGCVARTARGAQAIGMLLFFPMWLLSGAGPPREVLSDGMRVFADALPLTYAVGAIQRPWLGLPADTRDLAVLAGLLVVAAALSVRSVRQV